MGNRVVKKISYCLFVFMVGIGFNGCVVATHKRTVVRSKPLPPGHAKKISGDRSARRHAPGHNK